MKKEDRLHANKEISETMEVKEFERIFEQYYNEVFKMAMVYSKNKEDAEDIVQSTFMKLYKTERDFESDDHIKNWLIKVCINAAKDIVKSKKRLENFLKETKSTIHKSTKEQGLMEQIYKLSTKNRVVLILYYYYGYSVREISELLKIKEGTIRNRMKRSREILKLNLEEK